MKAVILTCIVILSLVFFGLQYGLKAVAERLYYGPDKSDCIRIVGCQEGDTVVWAHHDIMDAFICENGQWEIYEITTNLYDDEEDF